MKTPMELEIMRFEGQMRMLDNLNAVCDAMKEAKEEIDGAIEATQQSYKCEFCKHRDKYGMCVKIRDIFGYELEVHNECIFSDNFEFTEVE